ncbi:MFS transporter [Rhodococcus sp. ACT016]|uniref:MFS transporter n=1 Tax=Rhodococcus sp. ACT016 TaxID=3134808 RepID=UPI003D2907A4
MTGLIVFLYLVNYADKAVLGIIAQPLARELGLTASQIGLVGSLFFLTFTIGGFLAGPLNKLLTLRWALLALGIAWSVVMLPLVVSASLVMLVVTRMALGLAEGPGSALMHTGIYSWHPPAKRGLPSAILISSASVAKIALAPALAFVTVTWGWRAAIVTLSLLGAIWTMSWLAGWKEGPFIGPGAGKVVEGEASEPSVPWRRIFLNRTFVSCSFLVMALYALSTVVLTWLPSYFEVGLGFSALQAGSLFGLPSIVGLVVGLGAAVVTDRLVSRGVRSRAARIVTPAIGVVIAGVTLLFLPSISAPALAVAAVSIGYGFGAAAFPLVTAAISELCPPQQTAGTMGVFLAIQAIGGLLAPYGTGLIVDHASSAATGYATAFQLIGAIALVASLAMLALANPDRDSALVRGHVRVLES